MRVSELEKVLDTVCIQIYFNCKLLMDLIQKTFLLIQYFAQNLPCIEPGCAVNVAV